MNGKLTLSILSLLVTLLGGCTPPAPPLRTVPGLNLERFMGDWYVVAHIPTALEDQAYGAVESYSLTPEGTVATTFTFSEGSFDGPLRRYDEIGFPNPGSGDAVWGMRFLWPFKAEFRVMYLDAGYATTLIGRSARDYAWIMARSPVLPTATLIALTSLLESEGYAVTGLRIVPQRL